MYYYLYDTFLNDRGYEKVLDHIKTRLLDLDIQGKHERLSLLKSLDELIETEVKRGAKTIIVLGNDKTFLKAVDVVTRLGVTLGIIPIGPDNEIADTLGIPQAEDACEVVAARKIAHFDLGQANNVYFFSNLSVTKNIDRIAVSHQGYKVMPKPQCNEVAIYNFFFPKNNRLDQQFDKVSPQDEQLDLVVKSKIETKGVLGRIKKTDGFLVDSIIQGLNFEVKSFEYLPLMVDGYKVMKTPVSVRLADKKIKVIIGKTDKDWI